MAVKSAFDCSKSGIDAVEVIARTSTDALRATFPCFSEFAGALGRGPDLAAGQQALSVSTLSPSGQVLTGPVIVHTDVPDEGVVQVNVDLPRPPACADGVDNDGDGAADAFDRDCLDIKGTYDPTATEGP